MPKKSHLLLLFVLLALSYQAAPISMARQNFLSSLSSPQIHLIASNEGKQENRPVSNIHFPDVEEKLAFEEGDFNWRKDWWKYLSLGFASLLLIYLAVRVAKMLFRIILFAGSFMSGIFGGYLLGPILTPQFEARMAEPFLGFFQPHHLAKASGFFIFYFGAIVLILILRKPFCKATREEKTKVKE